MARSTHNHTIQLGWDYEITDGVHEDSREAVAPPLWFEHYGQVIELATHLVKLGYTTEELLEYLREPYSYRDEWNDYQKLGRE